MPDGKAPPQRLWIQERIRPYVLGDRQSDGVVRPQKDGLSQGVRCGKVLKIVEMIDLIEKRKMKEKRPVLNAVRSR